MTLSRRLFGQQTLGALLTYSLLETLYSRDAFGDDMKRLAAKWIKDLNDLGQDVKGKKLPQVEWQKKVDELLGQVDLTDTLKFLDFEKLTANLGGVVDIEDRDVAGPADLRLGDLHQQEVVHGLAQHQPGRRPRSDQLVHLHVHQRLQPKLNAS
jgi:hypothetical protein